MKFTAILCMVFCPIIAFTLTIIDGDKQYMVGFQQLSSFEKIKLETKRDWQGNTRIDRWQGILLSELLLSYNIESYDHLILTSDDYYQVRISSEEVNVSPALLAMQHNDTVFEEGNYRLVVPGKRSMYWVRNISQIQTGFFREMILPDVLYFGEDLLHGIKQTSPADVFAVTKGYLFVDLISSVYPFMDGEFLVLGRDGILQRLDFETYLKEAVLIPDNQSFTLQSPDMPSGMWVKKLHIFNFWTGRLFSETNFKILMKFKNCSNGRIHRKYCMTMRICK